LQFYDVEYALISHPLSSAFEDKVCIYCAMRIQKDVMDRKLQEYGTYLDENLPDIIPTILKDGEFRSMFQNHLRLYGTIDIICDDKSYIRGRRTFIKMMIEHIYPKYYLEFYMKMTEKDLKSIQVAMWEYVCSLLKKAAWYIQETDERMKYSMPREFDISGFLSKCEFKNQESCMTEQEKNFLDELIADCFSILDEELEEEIKLAELLVNTAPKAIDVKYFLRNYKNGAFGLKIWYFNSRDTDQFAAMIFPDDYTSPVSFYDWFNTSKLEKYIEPRYIFSKEVIERIDIPSNQETAEMKQAALQTVLKNLKEQDEALREEYQLQLKELEEMFDIDTPWNDEIDKMNGSEDGAIQQEDLQHKEAISSRSEITERDIRRYYYETTNGAFDCIYDDKLTLEEKRSIINRFMELQNMIWKDRYLLPTGETINLKQYRDRTRYSGFFDSIFKGNNPKSLMIYFHNWRIQKDSHSLEILLGKIYERMESKLVFVFEKYMDFEPYKPDNRILSDRLPCFVQINRCCNLLNRYLHEAVPIIDSIDEEELILMKCSMIDSLYDMPSEAFNYTSMSDSQIYEFKLPKKSLEEMRYEFLLNAELPLEVRDVVESKVSESAKRACIKRMETAVAEVAIRHIGEMLDVISILIDILSVLPEIGEKLHREEEQQLLKARGRLRKQLMNMGEICFLEAEIYEEYLRSRSIKIIETNERFSARYKEQFNCFMGGLELIGSRNVEELMEQRRRFILEFSIDPELEQNLNSFLKCLMDKIIDSLKDGDSYCMRRQQIQEQLSVYPVNIHDSVISTLTTAEELYYTYIDGKEPAEGFDYSCIAIMYFQALENLLNRLIYAPYKSSCLEPKKRDIYLSFKTKQNYTYLPYANSMSFYFSKYNDVNNCFLKSDMTLGTFPYLFWNVGSLGGFKAFLKDTFNTQTIDVKELKSFGDSLNVIAKRRNDAAHGSKVLDSETVISDRVLVYNENKAASEQIKAAINQFLSMFC